MSSIRTPLVAGNWKMNGLRDQLHELTLIAQRSANLSATVDLMICPPSTLISQAVYATKDVPVSVGAQDCHTASSGAFTGEISAEMIADLDAKAVILGHSERRTYFDETSQLVQDKVNAVHRAGLMAIVCIGETEVQRDTGQTLAIVSEQLSGSLPDSVVATDTVVAYEPVWAIGTGRTPTVEDVAEVHQAIRQDLIKRFGTETGEGIRVLYGGSVKPANAKELMGVANVDGALVGGASLKADDFIGIASVYA